MVFVDGENLTIRSQQTLAEWGWEIPEEKYFKRDCFMWLPGVTPYELACTFPGPDPHVIRIPNLIRASYYASVTGDLDLIHDIRQKLRDLGFDGQVFKKARKDQKAKGVDIALTKDVLSHAFLGNYDVAVLVAGDADYIPLVEEVKRLGKQVFLGFISNGLSPELRLAADAFFDLTTTLNSKWLWAGAKPKGESSP